MGLFKDALKFPFHPFKRMWWFWINLIPVIGWILYAGYAANIVKRIVEKEENDLPPMGEFWPTLKIGFLYLLLIIILGFITELFLAIPRVGWIPWLFAVLVSPIMVIRFAVTRRLADGFDVVLATKLVFGHFWKYIVYNLCVLAIVVVWCLASLPIITMLITIPAMTLGSFYIMARFYRDVQPKGHLYNPHHHKKH